MSRQGLKVSDLLLLLLFILDQEGIRDNIREARNLLLKYGK
jgi:hypothetical protein